MDPHPGTYEELEEAVRFGAGRLFARAGDHNLRVRPPHLT
jgi:hypothetical protein